jgi:hypothetical protein
MRAAPSRHDDGRDAVTEPERLLIRGSDAVTTWLNTSFPMRFRVIDGLTVRFA